MPLKIYKESASSPEFWQKKWTYNLKDDSLEKYYQNYGKTPIIADLFERYLPKEGKILEAGCGLGPIVYILKKKGYDILGIDFARETIEFVKSRLPEMPVEAGDVFSLNYSDSSFAGYISWGVGYVSC